MKNLLVIDAGNTNIVIGIYKGDDLIHLWRIHTDRKKLGDEYAELLDSLLQKHNLKPEDIDDVAISSVVPDLKNTLNYLAREHFKTDPFYVNHRVKLNLTIKIDNPGELGADLIASAAGAVEVYGAPCVVIDFGTATTLTAINREREILGGSIAPGLNISREALYTNAPHLPRVDLTPPPSIVGTNTVHALQSGIFVGYSYMISGLVEEMKNILGTDARVIATGGLSLCFKEIEVIDKIDPSLVLDGIKLLYELNKR